MAEEKKEPAKEKEAAADGAAKEGEGEAAAASPANKKKKLIIIGGAALLVLILGAVGGVLLLKKGGAPDTAEQKTTSDKHALDSRRGRKATPETEAGVDEGKEIQKEKGGAKEGGAAGSAGGANAAGTPSNYEDLQEFLVNLNTGGRQTSFLKLVVTLDISDASSRQAVDANLPRIRDSFQVYLRELRAEDLRGSAGLQLLREELLLRVNKIIDPAKIDEILIKEIKVQ